MPVVLWDRSEARTTLVPWMLRWSAHTGEWLKSGFPQGAPVVELVGDRAMGKTSFLRDTEEAHRSALPTVYLDLEADGWYTAQDVDARNALDTPYASPVTNILYRLRFELSGSRLDPKGEQTLRFPRLSLLLGVLKAWDPGGNRGAAGAVVHGRGAGGGGPPDRLSEVASALDGELRAAEAAGPEDPARATNLVALWAEAAVAVLGGALAPPGFDQVMAAVRETLTYWSRGKSDPALDWWAKRIPGVEAPVRKVLNLVDDFRSPVPGRRGRVEEHLLGALFADIDGSYGWMRRLRSHPALVLLDNLDEPLRERWLEPYVRQYGELGPEGRTHRVMRPATLVTSRGEGAGFTSVVCPRDSQGRVDTARWRDSARIPPRQWLLRLGIPRVSPDDTAALLREAGAGVTADRLTRVDRLGAGRTGPTRLLAEAEARAADEERVLHHRAEPGGPTVAARILGLLLPDPVVREAALSAAPALDWPAACTAGIPARHQSPHSPTARALGRPYANRSAWTLGSGQGHVAGAGERPGLPVVQDPALRAVLLHVLRTEGDGARWRTVHERLEAYYTARAGDDAEAETLRLHHAMALGKWDSEVLPHLHGTFSERRYARWLRDVQLLAAAPEPHGGYPRSGSTDVCPHCVDDTEAELHREMASLLLSLWRLASPLARVPVRGAPELAMYIGQPLTALGRSAVPAAGMSNPLAEAAETWGRELSQGRQPPFLSLPGGAFDG